MAKQKTQIKGIEKSPTGVAGLDEITGGGLPAGRPTLVCGSAGCGKTLLSIEFLVRGATQFREHGVFIAFEEKPEELASNVASLGFDLRQLEQQGKLSIDHVQLDRSEIEETGEYDLEGLFVRLDFAIRSVNAKRVVIDTIETLFSGLNNEALLRMELVRLFRWLKDRGVTTVITGERGEGTLTRHGLEEYVSDCVILLDHRVNEQISTRRLRVVKYRGTSHGTNEYPFLIDKSGFSVLPITSLGLDHAVSRERLSTGIDRLDAMLGGKGVYRGTSVLISGTAGTGKTSLAGHVVHAACKKGERCLYFAFEESPQQIIRNMDSIGLDLGKWRKKGLLHFFSSRPQLHGLEMHLVTIHRQVDELQPSVVVIDPISSLTNAGFLGDAAAAMLRLVDLFKSKGITVIFTSLTEGGSELERTDIGMSSLMDTWLLLKMIEIGGERNRGLYVLKSRGMNHSNQIREYLITSEGIKLLDVYVGPEGVLTGSARVAQEARDRAAERLRKENVQLRRREQERRRAAMEAKIAAIRSDYEANALELQQEISYAEDEESAAVSLRDQIKQARHAEAPNASGMFGKV
jgi:circadian clock protein KaiC